MTHSAPNERCPATASIGSLVADLTLALVSLNHTAVDVCCSRLEELAPRLIREQEALVAAGDGGLAQLVELRSSVRLARTLSLQASRLYQGWARVAALQGSAYTPAGQEPAPAAAGCVALDA